jgi:hypothetical protein
MAPNLMLVRLSVSNGSKDKEGKNASHRSYNNRLDLSHAGDDCADSSSSVNADPDFAAAVAQSLAEPQQAPSAHQDQRKKPPVCSQQDQVKSRPHVALANLQEPLGTPSAIATSLLGGSAPSYDGTFEPPDEDDNVPRRPPIHILPPNPAPHVPPPAAAAQFVSPSSNNGGHLHAPIPVCQEDQPGSLAARVVARSMRTALQHFGGLHKVDEPAKGWQPMDDKDTKRARKRIKHMSENPQIVSMVLGNYAVNFPNPDSQEAIVIYDEITNQWDD